MSLPQAAAPVATPTAPSAALPEHACDAHVHMVADDFPLWEGRVEDPAPGGLTDWLDRFELHMKTLGLSRAVIVHSILYGADNAVTKAAVAGLGTHRARGIGLVTDNATERDLDDLAEAGIVGVRLNYVHGGVLSWDGVKRIAPMLKDREMHVQMLLHTHKHMIELADDMAALPVPVVLDHIGWPDLALTTNDQGFQIMRRLLGDGHIAVKLSGLYRLCPAPYTQAAPFIEALVGANPDACLWGSDWPHLMLADAAQPDAGVLLNAFLDVVTAQAHRLAIFTDTPARLYGF